MHLTTLLIALLVGGVATSVWLSECPGHAKSPTRDRALRDRCLHPCDCSKQHTGIRHKPRTIVKCHDMLEFPSVYPHNTTDITISLEGSTLHSIADTDLKGKGLGHVLNFVATNSSISVVHVGAFSELVNVKSIDLSYNEITHFTLEHVKYLRKLRHLKLKGNSLKNCHALKKGLPKVKLTCECEFTVTGCSYDVSTKRMSHEATSHVPRTSHEATTGMTEFSATLDASSSGNTLICTALVILLINLAMSLT